MDLLLGPLVEGRALNPANPLECFDAVDLTTPVHPLFPSPDESHASDPAGQEQLIGETRELLRAGVLPEFRGDPLPGHGNLLQLVIRDQMARYIEPSHPQADRLYVLEFQGPRQYVMFGHSTKLLGRVTEHQRAATPHGFAMLNGWASPWVLNAQPLEQVALFIGGMIHHQHYRERFYEMPFEWGLKLARTVFEMNTDWRSRRNQQSPGA